MEEGVSTVSVTKEPGLMVRIKPQSCFLFPSQPLPSPIPTDTPLLQSLLWSKTIPLCRHKIRSDANRKAYKEGNSFPGLWWDILWKQTGGPWHKPHNSPMGMLLNIQHKCYLHELLWAEWILAVSCKWEGIWHLRPPNLVTAHEEVLLVMFIKC